MNRKLLNAYNYQLEKINQDESAGLISDEQAAEFRELLMSELEEAQFGTQETDEQVAEFSAGNSLGATLLELGDELGYEDAEEYLMDLSDELGLDPEETFALITIDEEPDESLSYDVLSALGLVEDEEEYDEDEIEDEVYEEEEVYDEEPASYSAYDPRVDELESQIAEFQASNALKDVLHKLDNKAQNLIEAGDLPPVAYDILFGSFDTEDDRIAAFSQVAESNGNNLNEELVKIQGALELFERMGLGEIGLFNELIEDEVMSNFSAEDQLTPDEEAIIAGTSAYITKQRG